MSHQSDKLSDLSIIGCVRERERERKREREVKRDVCIMMMMTVYSGLHRCLCNDDDDVCTVGYTDVCVMMMMMTCVQWATQMSVS